MLRRTMIMAILAGFCAAAVPLGAHENYRIVGTVTGKKSDELTVKTKEGRTIAMTLPDDPIVTRDKKKVKIEIVKIGTSVVVNALGDTIDDLTITNIMIVPALTKRK